jgi:gamma-glutamyltranspeptidase/glutathione hydrolase
VVVGGAGARAFDGRSLQPGLGAPRPRGFVSGAAIAEAARAPAPRAVAMLALLHGLHGRLKLSDLTRAGVAAAEHAGAERRAALLKRVGTMSVLALRGGEVERELLAALGPAAGGQLTSQDLTSAPAEAAARRTPLAEGAVALAPPWQGALALPAQSARAILAGDARGVLAALAYVPESGGLAVEALELEVGREATPVLRGVPRVAPGTPIDAPAPIAAVQRVAHAGRLVLVALPGQSDVPPSELAPFTGDAPHALAMAELRARAGSDALAVAWDGHAAKRL